MPEPSYTPQNAGYFEGVTDVYYALMTTEDTPSSAPVYGTPAVAGKTIEITITPNYREGKVYASNVATRREQRVDSYTVSLNLDQIIPSVRKVLLGRDTDTAEVEILKGSKNGPWVAIMFSVTLDDNSKEYWAMYKGRFAEPTNTHHTVNDSASYQHPTIQATFVRLENNDALAAIASTHYVASTVTDAWFTTVYQTAAAAASDDDD